MVNASVLTAFYATRGFSVVAKVTGQSAPGDPWRSMTLDALERDVRTTVLPDDDDNQDEHPWECFAGLLRAHGVEASPEELRLLPYDIVFSRRLQARMAAA